jgi:hypothetical protein
MHWYQFTLTINRDRPHLSTIFFPDNPCDYPPIGLQIAAYLEGLGMKSYVTYQDDELGVKYFYVDNKVNTAGLEALYQKFESKGAIKMEKSEQVEVTREEFEQLKKESAIADQELQALEKELRNLQNRS